MVCTPDHLQLFTYAKVGFSFSPTLESFEPNKPIIFKTNWSERFTYCIIIQPNDGSKLLYVMHTILATGNFLFNLASNGPNLERVQYIYSTCLQRYKWFHSFIIQVFFGRRYIVKNKIKLRQSVFYWVCNCSAVLKKTTVEV